MDYDGATRPLARIHYTEARRRGLVKTPEQTHTDERRIYFDWHASDCPLSAQLALVSTVKTFLVICEL